MTLVVMSGLPGSGKTNLAAALARELRCALVSVDTVERGLHTAGVDPRQPVGLAAYAVANEVVGVQLALGHAVVADAVGLRRSWTPWPVSTVVVDTADGPGADEVARGVVRALVP